MRRRASGSFELPIPASAGIGFFTPEGERRWVPGWDPAYPSGEPSETPGTVFITEHGDTAESVKSNETVAVSSFGVGVRAR
jgi:hypothetical protein